MSISAQHEIKPADFAVTGGMHVHQKRAVIKMIKLVAWLVREIELCGQCSAIGWRDLDVIMRGASGIFGRADRFEIIAALRIGFLITAQFEAAIVILPVLVGMPQIDRRPGNRFAIIAKHIANQRDPASVCISTEITLFWRIVGIEWTFGA